MGLHHLHRRKLMPEICELICHGKEFVSCSSKPDCDACFKICLTNPQYPYYNYPPPPPPSKIPPSFYLNEEDEDHQHKISTYLILTLALLATIFFVVCCRLIYKKLRSRRRTITTTSSTQQREETLDEEQGPMVLVDHPIWYIRTQGLHHSIINSITICKYKKGEGLIEGTECSVCLSEFQDDESLRLLPKCYHAFHLPCIDTWLRSHTNCPICRAPIVTNPNPSIPMIPSLDSIVVDSTSSRMENNGGGLENTTTSSNGSDTEERELEIEEVVTVRPRRSVSLDDSLVAIANINNLAIANVLSGESSGGDSDGVLKVIGNKNLATTSNSKGSSSFRLTRNLKGVPSPMKRSRSYNGKYLLSWYSRSQRKSNASLNKIDM